MVVDSKQRKPLVWCGASKVDLKACSEAVRRDFGYALSEVQKGNTPTNAKVLKGFRGASVAELKADDEAGTYRAVYTVKFEEAVYVLHVFAKKSKRGGQLPAPDKRLIETRLKEALARHKAATVKK